MAAERMSRVDTAWLRMDNDVNLMMIVGVWLLRPAATLEALVERVSDKLLKYDRFRQKVVQDAMGASWVVDDDFDIRRHVLREKLAAAPGQTPEQALQARCGELATTPLDPREKSGSQAACSVISIISGSSGISPLFAVTKNTSIVSPTAIEHADRF